MLLVYLASPYSHPDPLIKRQRFWRVTEAAALLTKELASREVAFYVPIIMTHPMECVLQVDNQNLTHEEWMQFDSIFWAKCDELWVLKLDGWEESSGVREEIEYFTKAGKTIRFIPPCDHDWIRVLRARIIMEPA
jgi:hypothetical protein